MTAALEARLRAKSRDLIPTLPSFDMPCERKVTRDGETVPCGAEPTYLLRRRHRHNARSKEERRLYCEDHTIGSASVWEPVKGVHPK